MHKIYAKYFPMIMSVFSSIKSKFFSEKQMIKYGLGVFPNKIFGKTIYWGRDLVWHVFVYWGQKKKGSEQ